jgi:hypothetical protein
MPATESPASSYAGRTSALPLDVRPSFRPAPATPSVQASRPAAPAARSGAKPAPDPDPIPARTRPPAAGILVTGSHRSGTTWVGKMLAEAEGLCYLHEPFKPKWDPPYVWTHFDTWFLHVGPHNASEHERAVARTLGLRFSWRRHFGQDPSLRQLWTSTDHWLRWAGHRLRGRRPLVKDPIALFAAPWLADRFDLDVVAMIRHPAAFASSIKLKRWHFDFDHWRRQEQLMAGLLAPFAGDVRRMAEHNDDLIEQAALQWRCFHHAIREYRRTHPHWQFVRHEDLSLDPAGGFRRLYAALGLAFTPACERAVRASSDAGNVTDAAAAGKAVGWVNVDSAANVKNWQRRLTPDEVRRVRDGTADVWPDFYSDQDWE